MPNFRYTRLREAWGHRSAAAIAESGVLRTEHERSVLDLFIGAHSVDTSRRFSLDPSATSSKYSIPLPVPGLCKTDMGFFVLPESEHSPYLELEYIFPSRRLLYQVEVSHSQVSCIYVVSS